MLFQFLTQNHPVNHNEPNTTSKVYLQNLIKSDKMGRNDILNSNSSSFPSYLLYNEHQFPISTNITKTMLKPILEQPSLSSLPKKTDNFKRKNDVNNLKKSKRSTSSITVSRRKHTADQYQKLNLQIQKQIDLNRISKSSHLRKGKNIILLRKIDSSPDILHHF